MDNETPQPSESVNNSQNGSVAQTPNPANGPSNGMRVIQPLNPNLQVDSTPQQAPPQPYSAVPVVTPPSEAENTVTQPVDVAQTSQSASATSSIYPQATRGFGSANYQMPSPAETKKDTDKSYDFQNGYASGGAIFWRQLVAGIVLGLILYGIDSSLLKGASANVSAIVSLFYYLVEFLVIAYIPYATLKEDNIEQPFWLTTFGIAFQSIILATLFELLISFLIQSVINHGVASSIAHIGGPGLGILATLVYIGFFVALYYLTKLSWGIAFVLFGKIKNKMIVKAIGICIIAFIVGGIGYHYITTRAAVHQAEARVAILSDATTYQNNNNNSPNGSLSDPLVSNYAPVTLKAHDFSLSLNFDPNYSATIHFIPTTTYNGIKTARQEDIFITGNELGTADKMSVDVTRVGVNSGGVNPTECASPNSTPPIHQGINLLNYATVMGQKVAVCGFNQQSTSRTAYFKANGIYYSADFNADAGLSVAYSNSVQLILSSIQVR